MNGIPGATIPQPHSQRDEVERLFLLKLLGDSTVQDFDHHVGQRGLNIEHFQEPLRPIIQWVKEYRTQHREMPDTSTAARKWVEIPQLLQGYRIPAAGLSPIYEEVISSALRDDLLGSLQDVRDALVARKSAFDIKDAMAMHVQVLNAKYARRGSEVRDYHEYADLLATDYIERQQGVKLGIPCPFLFIQEQLGGWHPAQITTVVAPTSVGKTWWIILCTVAALLGDPYHFHRPPDIEPWPADRRARARRRVLFVSLEMPAIDIARRMAAVTSGTSFNRLMHQNLGDVELARYMRHLQDLKPGGAAEWFGGNLRLIGPNEAATPDQIAAQADEFGADMVVIDGFYYMDGPGDDRWRKVEFNMRQMRLHTLMSDRHYLLATQLKRGEGTLNRAQPDSVAFSHSISHDSNNMVFLIPPKNPGNNTRTIDQKLGKARDGSLDQPYRFNWDLYEMQFGQLGPVQDLSTSSQSAY